LKNTDMVVDAASSAHLTMASLILASYQVLNNSYDLPHQEVSRLLGNCLCRNIKEWMGTLLHFPLLTPNPIPGLSSGFSTIIRLRGKTFHIGIQEDKRHSAFLHVDVQKCFFHDFFRKNGASYLTSLFCIAEQKMLEGIDPIQNNIKFQMEGTLAEGKKKCSFQFIRMQTLSQEELQRAVSP